MDPTWEPYGSYMYNRIMLFFHVDPARLQELLPAPWIPQDKGGVNLVVGLCEVWGRVDGKGHAVPTPTYLYVPFNYMALNEQTGERANMRYLTLSNRPEDAGNPLTKVMPATRELHVTSREGAVHVEEGYVFTDSDGTGIQVRVRYMRDDPPWFYGFEDNPEGMRVRYPSGSTQLSLYRNTEIHHELLDTDEDINRTDLLEYTITVPEMVSLFDGSESLLGANAIPASLRTMFRARADE